MEPGIHGLNHHMGYFVAGREVLEFTNNASCEAYEEKVPFQRPTNPIGIFRHEMNALRHMADGDPFEGLPTAVLPLNTQGNDGATGNRGNGGGTVGGPAGD